jgi:sulfotransferase
LTSDKRIYFMAGMPRSGSTLLANILAQHPGIHVTGTSGIVDMLVLVRNAWDKLREFQALDRNLSESIKASVLQGMLSGYFRHVERPICIDKNRRWSEYLETAAVLLGGRHKVKVIITVRDVRDVLASFETLYRKTAGLGQVPLEAERGARFKTSLGRLEVLLEDERAVGRPYHAVRDALTRGWRDCMHFVDYADLTERPRDTLRGIYRFLGEPEHEHDSSRSSRSSWRMTSLTATRICTSSAPRSSRRSPRGLGCTTGPLSKARPGGRSRKWPSSGRRTYERPDRRPAGPGFGPRG